MGIDPVSRGLWPYRAPLLSQQPKQPTGSVLPADWEGTVWPQSPYTRDQFLQHMEYIEGVGKVEYGLD